MGFLTQLWHDYATFASAGGAFRWGWMLLWTVTVLVLVLIALKPFVQFIGRAFMVGFRETANGPQGSEVQRREVMQRLATDIHEVTDRAAPPSA